MPRMPIKSPRPSTGRIFPGTISIGPSSDPGQGKLAVLHYKAGRFREAILAAENAVAAGHGTQQSRLVMGASHLALKNFDKAEQIFRKITKTYPEYASGHGNLGIALYELGRYDEARQAHQRAIRLDPDNANFRSNLGNTLRMLGQVSDAVDSYLKAVTLTPGNAIYWANLSLSQIDSGDLDAAEISCAKALQLNPQLTQGWTNLGRVQAMNGHRKDAQASFLNALDFTPTDAQALFNIAMLCHQDGDTEKAIDLWRRALLNDPRHAEARYNLACALQDGGALEEAAKEYTRVLYFDKRHSKALNNLGGIRLQEGDAKQAIALFMTALSVDPELHDATVNLVEAYIELGDLNRANATANDGNLKDSNDRRDQFLYGRVQNKLEHIDEATRVFQEILKTSADDRAVYYELLQIYDFSNSIDEIFGLVSKARDNGLGEDRTILLFEAIGHLRNKNYAVALEAIRRIDHSLFGKELLIRYYETLGTIYDKSNATAEAFEAFSRMNALSAEFTPDMVEKVPGVFKALNTRRRSLHSYRPLRPDFPPLEAPIRSVGFIVGFPRSGTTLLDTVMRSHSRITVIEEKPLFNTAVKETFHGALPELSEITADQILTMRSRYLAALRREIPDDLPDGMLVVDKLPLNLNQLPYIDMMFPASPIIFAARHPFDAILSNFMQNFSLNPAMACMLKLETAARLYDESMKLFESFFSRVEINVHLYRYESIVEDFEGEVRKLLNFLDLEWEEAIHEYRTTARSRGRINTPSYKQVVQPIYRESAYRWHRYEDHIAEIRETIQPYEEKLGYSQTGKSKLWPFVHSVV